MNTKIIFFILSICVIDMVFGMAIDGEVNDNELEVFPPGNDDNNAGGVFSVDSDNHLMVQTRVTCDLLSYLNANHTFCAAHCILIGKKGGACNAKGVCVCRN